MVCPNSARGMVAAANLGASIGNAPALEVSTTALDSLTLPSIGARVNEAVFENARLHFDKVCQSAGIRFRRPDLAQYCYDLLRQEWANVITSPLPLRDHLRAAIGTLIRFGADAFSGSTTPLTSPSIPALGREAGVREFHGEYVRGLSPDHELIAVSYFVTNPKAVALLQKNWKKRNSEHSKVLGTSKQDVSDLMSEAPGGSIALLDPQRLDLGILVEVDVPLAFGMQVAPGGRGMVVGGGSAIHHVRHGAIIAVSENRLFNDIHGLSLSRNGRLLVASTGTDGIFEVDFANAGKVHWDWIASENGFGFSANGVARTIDRACDYTNIITTTPEHSTHINSVLNHREGKLLATLFHQGSLVEIDMATGESRPLVTDLRSPHSIRRRQDGYILCDSRNGRVLFLDENQRVEHWFESNFNWVQDAAELNDRTYIAADSNNSRLVRVTKNGELQGEFFWGHSSRKVSSLQPLTASIAKDVFLNSQRHS
jgi:hypothetical protein